MARSPGACWASVKPPAVARKTMIRRVVSTNMGFVRLSAPGDAILKVGGFGRARQASRRGPPSPEGAGERCGGPGPLGQRLVQLLLGLLLAHPDGEGELGDQDLAGAGQHPLLARGE